MRITGRMGFRRMHFVSLLLGLMLFVAVSLAVQLINRYAVASHASSWSTPPNNEVLLHLISNTVQLRNIMFNRECTNISNVHRRVVSTTPAL